MKKYCRSCGNRLQDSDGAYWKFDHRCLWCRLKKLFAVHGIDYKG